MSDLEELKNNFAKLVFGRERKENQCVMCGKAVNPNTDFPDLLSKKEFFISYMCFECQEKVFNEPDDD